MVYTRDIVDIGGDRYYLGYKPNKGARRDIVELHVKSRSLFERYFGKDHRTFDLVKKYLYFGHPTQFKINTRRDRNDLIDILHTRVDQLASISRNKESPSIKGIITTKKYNAILDLIDAIEVAQILYEDSDSDYTESDGASDFNADISELKEEDLYKIMVHLAWYLLHPDFIKDEVHKSWMNVIKHIQETSIDDIVSGIKDLQSDNSSPSLSEYMEPFSHMDHSMTYKNGVHKMKKSTRKNNSKKAAVAKNDKASTEKMKNRLVQILRILEARKYLKMPDDPLNSSIDDSLKDSLIMNPLYMKGGSLIENAMTPLFDYLKNKQDKVYSKAEKSLTPFFADLTERHEQHPQVIKVMLTLLGMCNSLTRYGLYRVANIPVPLMEYLTFYLTGKKTKIDTKDSILAAKTVAKVEQESSIGPSFVYIFAVGSNLMTDSPSESDKLLILRTKEEFTGNTLADYNKIVTVDYATNNTDKEGEFTGGKFSVGEAFEQSELVTSILLLIKSLMK